MTKRKKLVSKLDKVFSLYIRKRDKKCVCCGKTENLQNGHLITRAKYSVRWSELNCHCQCRGCNMLHEFQPHIFINWFLKKYGLKKFQYLILESNQIKKFTDTDLEELIKKYEL
jgi:hypothetical protein